LLPGAGYDVSQASMTLKHPSLDYEPIRRTPASSSSNDMADAEFHFNRPATALTADEMDSAESATSRNGASQRENAAARQGKSDLKSAKENWIHKHGHSVSYAGIFLFTALVFFRPYELSPSLFWLSTSAFWIAVVTVVVYVLTQLGLENSITARPKEITLVLLLLVTGALSIPLALEPQRAFDGFIEFLKVVLIFIIMINVVRTEKRLNRLWVLVLAATCILSISAINDYRLGQFELRGIRIKGLIGGLFDNPNDLALHLVTMVPIALGFSLKSRNPLTKVLFLIAVILITSGIVATFSRGGFLALLAVLGVFIWKIGRNLKWAVPVLAVTGVVVFVLVAPGGYRTRLSTTGDESTLARFDDLKRSLFIAARHPILGVGMDNYILFSNTDKASHNAYTQVASEMGAAAAVFYVLFMLAPLKGLRRIERKSSGLKSERRFYYASIALQASLIGYMVASFFASVAYLWYIYYLVAYSVCLRRIYDSAVERDGAIISALNGSSPNCPEPEVSPNVHFTNI
ncbi:MAG: O-antigen ligase family protein, partial [Pyrinomonadaceae bacterium]